MWQMELLKQYELFRTLLADVGVCSTTDIVSSKGPEIDKRQPLGCQRVNSYSIFFCVSIPGKSIRERCVDFFFFFL